MTEDQWLTSKDPAAMLSFLRNEGRLTERKARLFAVACCRRIWSSLADERSRNAVELGERYADGHATDAELAEVCERARRAVWEMTWDMARYAAWATAWQCLTVADVEADRESGVVTAAHYAAQERQRARDPDSLDAEVLAQASLLRDIFNPFCTTDFNAPWRHPAIIALGKAAYDDRRPDGFLDQDRLAVLGDALEEAGCTDAQVLGHLRSAGPHCRGCFGLDLVLGKS